MRQSGVDPDRVARFASDINRSTKRLEAIGVLERVRTPGRSFRLSKQSQAQLGTRIRSRRTAIDDHWAKLHSYLLDDESQIKREEAAIILGVTPTNAGRILSTFVTTGKLDFVDKRRGRNVRYRLM